MPRASRSRSRSPSKRRHKKHKKKSRREGKEADRRRRRSRSSSPSSSSTSTSSTSSREARRKVRAAKRFLKAHLKSGGAGSLGAPTLPPFPAPDDPLLPPGAPDPPALTPAEYFVRHPEFSAWLAAARGVAFADLGPGEGRRLFEGPFCVAWNGRALPARFYAMAGGGEGQPGTDVAAAPLVRTVHDWGLKKPAAETGAAAKAAARAVHRDRLEEAAPRPDPGSHEARQAARAGRAAAAAEREASPDAGAAPDLGGDGETFAAARAREAAAAALRDRRAAERGAGLAAKAAAAQAAEDARMAAFRALVAAGPITIAKRPPPSPE